MNVHLLRAVIVTAGFVGAAALAAPATVVLGTATEGGGFELYGRHLAETISATDASLKIEIRVTRGSAENLPLLEAGKLDIGLVEGNAAHVAFAGIERPKTALRIVAAMYPGPGMFVVRGDSTVRTIADLKGKPVAFGTPASGLTTLARDVLDGLGLTPERDFQAVFLQKAGDGPTLVLEGKVAALWGGGIGWPGFTKVAAGPGGARFIVPDAGEIRLAAQLAQGRYTTAANTASEAPRPELLHPGAARYLREIGALR